MNKIHELFDQYSEDNKLYRVRMIVDVEFDFYVTTESEDAAEELAVEKAKDLLLKIGSKYIDVLEIDTELLDSSVDMDVNDIEDED